MPTYDTLSILVGGTQPFATSPPHEHRVDADYLESVGAVAIAAERAAAVRMSTVTFRALADAVPVHQASTNAIDPPGLEVVIDDELADGEFVPMTRDERDAWKRGQR
jgi:hypothetical protein